MNPPDFFAALYAAVATVVDGQTHEAEVTHEVDDDGRIETLTVIVRRYDYEHADTGD